MKVAPHSPWRAWLLLTVAVWLSFAPVATARLCQSATDGLPSAAGVCKYLYAHADPVKFIDPSGNLSLAELNISQAIDNVLEKIKDTRIVRAYLSRLGPKVYEIFLGTENNGHDYIYAKHLSGGRSWKYEIFTRGSRILGIPGLENGVFYAKPASDSSIRGQIFPVGLLSNKQFAIWNFLVVPFGFTEALGGGGKAWVPYNIPGVPGAFNCTKWAWEAVAAARVTSLIPAG